MNQITVPTSVRTIKIERIDIDEQVSPRAGLDPKRVEVFRGLTRHLPPIIVVADGERFILADGAHRFAAAEANGAATVQAQVVIPAAGDEPRRVARDVAIDFLRGPAQLKRNEQREAIRSAIQAAPQLADREIARRFTCSPTTVGILRREVNGLPPTRATAKRVAGVSQSMTLDVREPERLKAVLAAMAQLDPLAIPAMLEKMSDQEVIAAEPALAVLAGKATRRAWDRGGHETTPLVGQDRDVSRP